jgi:hypothetical protein
MTVRHADLADPDATPSGTGRGLLRREVPGQAPEQRSNARALEKGSSHKHESPPSMSSAGSAHSGLPI